MALVACKECGNEISDKAKSCPKCGAKNKKKSSFGKFWLVIFGLVLFGQIIGAIGNNHSVSNVSTNSAAPSQAVNDKQIMDTLRAEAHEVERAIIRGLRNPDSYKLSTVAANLKTGAICLEYRAQNGFGGMNVGRAAIHKGDANILDENSKGFKKIWKECLSNDAVGGPAIAYIGLIK